MMSDKRGLAVGGVVLVLALAVIVYLVSRDSRTPEAVPATGEVVAASPAEPEKPAGFQEPVDKEAERLLPAGGDAHPTPVGDVGRLAADGAGEPPLVARGHVTWAGGALPEDIDVVLYDADGSDLDLTTADKDGAYELRWDEPLASGWSVGTDTVMLTVNKQLVSLAPDNVGDLPLHLPGEPPVLADLVLGLPPVIIGRVTDRATGAAIEGAEITAVSAQRAWALDECFELSEEDGSYLLELEDLPLRQLIVWCRVDEWQAQMVGPQDIAFAAAPGEGLRIDFALDRPVAWRGHITSALDGLPVADATITIGNDLEAFSDYFDFEISDEQGNFELELADVPVEGAWVHVSASNLAPVALRGVLPGQELQIVMGAPVTLVGSVVGSDAQPVDGAAVTIAFDGETYWGDNGLYDEDFTDAEGAFDVPLEYAPGDAARLKIEAEGYAPYEAKLSELLTNAGPGTQQVKVTLTPSP
jgi:hypothetical protein